MTEKCPCDDKNFPRDFKRDELIIQNHCMCCNEIHYFCGICQEWLDTQATNVYENEEGEFGGDRLTANEYIKQWEHLQ